MLLRTAVGAELPEAAVAALGDRTEGWVAGLQLAALSLRGQDDIGAFVEGFSGSHRFVLDYLTEEVLDRQPEPLRAFLLETSILERLSGPLCAAVTGRADSQELLEQAERANLFLHPLDEVRGWWRYHHLFADLLRARLQQERPERVPQLHRAAAAWHEAQGLADEAIGHALAAGDATWAARLIERQVDARILRWEGLTLQRWFAALPAELVRSRPRLSLAQARLALIRGDLEAIEGPLEAAERRVAQAAGEPYEPSVGRAASMLANLPAAIALLRAGLAHLRGDAEQTMVSARRALAELGEGEWMLESVIRWHLCVAGWLRGDLVEAEAAITSGIAGWRAASHRAPAAAALGYHGLGLVQRDQGRLGAALATYREALAVAAEPDGPAPQLAGVAQVGMAGVLYERDELDAALEHATDGIALCRQLAYTPPLATGLVTLAWIRQAQGDQAGALDALGEAERVQLSPVMVGLINPVPAERARLALARATSTPPSAGSGPAASPPRTTPATRASASTWSWPGCCSPTGRPSRRSGCWNGCMPRRPPRGGPAASSRSRACRRWPTPPAATSPAPWPPWPRRSPRRARGLPARVRRRGSPDGRPAPPAAGRAAPGAPRRLPPCRGTISPGWWRPSSRPACRCACRSAAAAWWWRDWSSVSPRELEVLRLLAAGLSNQAIAEELVVSLDTVKRHVSHVRQAPGRQPDPGRGRARELGLL